MKICVVGIVPVPEAYRDAALDGIKRACSAALQADTQLFFRTPSRGPVSTPAQMNNYRNSYFQHRVKHEVIETLLDLEQEGFDAIVVNCFDDPGVAEARTVMATPVFGLSEATFHTACQLGPRFGAIVPDMPGQVAFVQAQIDAMGLAGRCILRGVRVEPRPFTESLAEAMTAPEAMLARIEQVGRELVADGADVVVVACGGLGQFCGEQQFHYFEVDGARVPVVVPLPVAVKQAEMMVAMQRAWGLPLPSQAHNARRMDADQLSAVRSAFSSAQSPGS